MNTKGLTDALLFLGREHQKEAWQASTLESIQRMQDRYRIARAFVNASSCRTVNAVRGNGELFETVQTDPRLIPCPSVIPNSGGDMGHESRYVEDLIRRGARAVCHHPQTHRTGLDERVIGTLYEALQKHRLPVSLFETSLLEAADLAKRYPRLPIILHAPTYRDLTFIPSFQNAPNLHLSLMPNFASFRGIENFIRLFGADRLLFATGFPLYEPGAPLAYLNYADISEQDRNKIASENLQRLLDEIGRPDTRQAEEDPVPFSENDRDQGICAHAFDGRPIEVSGMVDMHAHYGRLSWFPYEEVHGNALVLQMDRCGLEKIFVSHTPAMTTEVPLGQRPGHRGRTGASGPDFGVCHLLSGHRSAGDRRNRTRHSSRIARHQDT